MLLFRLFSARIEIRILKSGFFRFGLKSKPGYIGRPDGTRGRIKFLNLKSAFRFGLKSDPRYFGRPDGTRGFGCEKLFGLIFIFLFSVRIEIQTLVYRSSRWD